MRMRYRRKHHFVSRKQQLYFAGTLLLYCLFSIVVFCWATILPDPSFEANTQGGTFLPPALIQLIGLCLENWWAVLITVFLVGCSALLFSHQIFGPIRRLENVLQQKAEYPEEPVSCELRRTDYFQRFSKLLEEVLNKTQKVEKAEPGAEGPQ